MNIFLIILFIIECFGFCYLFYKILEISKDIDTLYDNYSNFIEKDIKTNVVKRSVLLK
jgi:hypothetical protein